MPASPESGTSPVATSVGKGTVNWGNDFHFADTERGACVGTEKFWIESREIYTICNATWSWNPKSALDHLIDSLVLLWLIFHFISSI